MAFVKMQGGLGAEAECGRCSKGVGSRQKALQCAVCEAWEHIGCSVPRVSGEDFRIIRRLSSVLWLCGSCEGGWKEKVVEKEAGKWGKVEAQLRSSVSRLTRKLGKARKMVRQEAEDADGTAEVRLDGVRDEGVTVEDDGAVDVEDPEKVVVGREGLRGVMLLGDSLVRGVGVQAGGKLEVRVLPGIGVSRMKKVLEEVSEEDAAGKGVIIHVGTNDVSGRDGWGKVKLVHEMEKVVTVAREKFGVGRVVVSGILYRRDMRKSVVDGMNDFLGRMCERMNVCFLEANYWLQGEGLGRDGLHLSSAGQRVFGELMERVGAKVEALA